MEVEDMAAVRQLIEVNVFGVFHATRAFAPLLRKNHGKSFPGLLFPHFLQLLWVVVVVSQSRACSFVHPYSLNVFLNMCMAVCVCVCLCGYKLQVCLILSVKIR
jgi:hypothetical protein